MRRLSVEQAECHRWRSNAAAKVSEAGEALISQSYSFRVLRANSLIPKMTPTIGISAADPQTGSFGRGDEDGEGGDGAPRVAGGSGVFDAAGMGVLVAADMEEALTSFTISIPAFP